MFPAHHLAVNGCPCVFLLRKYLIYQWKRPPGGCPWRPLFWWMVELAGIEPASASLRQADLHV